MPPVSAAFGASAQGQGLCSPTSYTEEERSEKKNNTSVIISHITSQPHRLSMASKASAFDLASSVFAADQERLAVDAAKSTGTECLLALSVELLRRADTSTTSRDATTTDLCASKDARASKDVPEDVVPWLLSRLQNPASGFESVEMVDELINWLQSSLVLRPQPCCSPNQAALMTCGSPYLKQSGEEH